MRFPARARPYSRLDSFTVLTVTVPVGSVRAGRHRLLLQVSDRQEPKNMENVLRILPNTAQLAASFSVR